MKPYLDNKCMNRQKQFLVVVKLIFWPSQTHWDIHHQLQKLFKVTFDARDSITKTLFQHSGLCVFRRFFLLIIPRWPFFQFLRNFLGKFKMLRINIFKFVWDNKYISLIFKLLLTLSMYFQRKKESSLWMIWLKKF